MRDSLTLTYLVVALFLLAFVSLSDFISEVSVSSMNFFIVYEVVMW